MAKSAISQENYLKFGGNRCVFCLSSDINGIGQVGMDGLDGYQEVKCTECEGRWFDLVYLKGYEIIDTPPGFKANPEGENDEDRIPD